MSNLRWSLFLYSQAMLEEADTTIAASASSSSSASFGATAGGLGLGAGMGSPSFHAASAGGSPSLALSPPGTGGAPGSRVHQQQAQELQRRLLQTEEEKGRIVDRMARLEDAEKLLNERLEKAHKESINFRMEATQATSEARFQKERSERLEELMKEAQTEMGLASQRRLDMERLLITSQQDARGKDEQLLQASESLRAVQGDGRTPLSLPVCTCPLT